jgi:hypothetical protein
MEFNAHTLRQCFSTIFPLKYGTTFRLYTCKIRMWCKETFIAVGNCDVKGTCRAKRNTPLGFLWKGSKSVYIVYTLGRNAFAFSEFCARKWMLHDAYKCVLVFLHFKLARVSNLKRNHYLKSQIDCKYLSLVAFLWSFLYSPWPNSRKFTYHTTFREEVWFMSFKWLM